MNLVADNRPNLSLTEAEAAVRDCWNLSGTAQLLPSDRDQNFRITSEDGNFVLKVAAANENTDVLHLQNQAMTLIARGDVPVAVPCPTGSGELIGTVQHQQRQHAVRLVGWLHGKPLAHVSPHSAQLLRDVGRTLGSVTKSLQDLRSELQRNLRWELQNSSSVFDACGGFIRDPEQRALFEQHISRIAQNTSLTDLRRGWIHNDGNDHNILVEESLSGQSVCGLIDFGDMVHSWIAADVAVTCAYAMLSKSDPLAAAANVVSGYHERFPLHENELAALFDLVCARLCMSVAICAEQKQAEPDNDYLSVSERPAWDLLARLATVCPRFGTAVFRDACGFEPAPSATKVIASLRHTAPHPLVDADISAENLFVHDLSVGSTEPATWTHTEDAETFDSLLLTERLQAERSVGIGRYDEPRLCYSSDQFAVSDETRRTIHIGLDIFAPAGTAVFAPLDGTVHSFANNAKPLDYGPTIILRHATEDGIEFFTLYGHLSEESITQLKVGQAVSRGDQIATFGSAAVNGGWPPHLHFQIMTDMLDLVGDFPGVAPAAERSIWLSLCPDPNLLARLPIDIRCPRSTQANLVSRRQQTLGPSLSLSYARPLHIVRGQRQFLFDADGRQYLDTVNNVAHVGHCHPHVVQAAQRQMAVLNTNTRYLHESVLEYAERLAALFPAPLEVCFFVCSGSEANELAIRLARAHTGRRDLIVLDSGYHGNTVTCVEASAYKFNGPGGSGSSPGIHAVRTPDAYRNPELVDGAVAAADVEQTISRLQEPPAAFLAEPIASCGGQIVAPARYLSSAYDHARAAGALCIADEVQTGFGRVGSAWWAFETQDAVPDIVTLGKPIGNGHPLGAVVTTREIANSFANGMEYFNTFGGNPVSSCVGLAVLDVIEKEGLRQNALEVGNALRTGLQDLADRHSLIGDVRGLGLFLGVEFVRDRESREPAAAAASYLVERMKQQGILASTDGPLQNVIKIKPPMVFTETDATRYCDALNRALCDTVLT